MAALIYSLLLAPKNLYAAVVPNGGFVSGAIAVAGQIDVHTFEGMAGQPGLVSISGTIEGGEFFTLFNPDGSQLGTGSGPTEIELSQTGTYSVFIQSRSGGRLGRYSFHYAAAPGAAEHGLIPNGGSVAQAIDDGGEIDSFAFSGAAGDVGLISVSGELTDGVFYYVYRPDGSLLTTGTGPEYMALSQTGIHTVIVRATSREQSGRYFMQRAMAPGANEHGFIPNGGSISEAIDDAGEIDSFAFLGGVGSEGQISISGDLPDGELMRVFNPDGSMLATTSGQLDLTLTQEGNHTVIVQSSSVAQTGSYSIRLDLEDVPANGPPTGDPQSLLTSEATALSFVMTGQDPDGDPLSFRVVRDPMMGALTGSPPSVTYTPDPGFIGSDSVHFVASDGQLDSMTATVSIQVVAAMPDAGVSDGPSTDGGPAVDGATTGDDAGGDGASDGGASSTDAGVGAAQDSGSSTGNEPEDEGCGCLTTRSHGPRPLPPSALVWLLAVAWMGCRRVRRRSLHTGLRKAQ